MIVMKAYLAPFILIVWPSPVHWLQVITQIIDEHSSALRANDMLTVITDKRYKYERTGKGKDKNINLVLFN